MLSACHTPPVLVLSLGLITVGYGLAVPSLSALFSHVPMQQGVMQGIAGSADRFGQAVGVRRRAAALRRAAAPTSRPPLRTAGRCPRPCARADAPLRAACAAAAVAARCAPCGARLLVHAPGPIAGMQLLGTLGERGLMNSTGIGLFLVCTVCVQFIRGSDGAAISTALWRGLWRQLLALKLRLGGTAGALASAESASLLRPESDSARASDDETGALPAARGAGAGEEAVGWAGRAGNTAGLAPTDAAGRCASQGGLTVRHPNREGLMAMARERSIPSLLHKEASLLDGTLGKQPSGGLSAEGGAPSRQNLEVDVGNGAGVAMLKRPRSSSIIVRNGVVGARSAKARPDERQVAVVHRSASVLTRRPSGCSLCRRNLPAARRRDADACISFRHARGGGNPHAPRPKPFLLATATTDDDKGRQQQTDNCK